MTDCPEQLTFDFHRRQAVVADFHGGLIRSDAGLMPLRQLDERLGWTAAVADLLGDSRQAAKVNHDLLALVRQRLFGLLASSFPLPEVLPWRIGPFSDCTRRR